MAKRGSDEWKKNIQTGVEKSWKDGKFKDVDYSKSDIQKKKISEARLKFYREHPEAAKEHSDRLKGRFTGKDNPNYGKKHEGINAGEKNAFWKGGVATLTWRGLGWKRRSKEIRKRDNNTCQGCGSRGNLQVHHIIPYRISKDNSDKNLITLCNHCHQVREWNENKNPNLPKNIQKV